MPEYQGSCHCKAIRFRFNADAITAGLRCNCSICRRKGALMSTFTIAPEDMHIDGADGAEVAEVADGALATYQFGSGIAQHHFCRRCGIYPFHQTLRKPGHYRINLGCVDGVDSFALPVSVFDGAAL